MTFQKFASDKKFVTHSIGWNKENYIGLLIDYVNNLEERIIKLEVQPHNKWKPTDE